MPRDYVLRAKLVHTKATGLSMSPSFCPCDNHPSIGKQLLRDTEYIERHSRIETGFEPASGVAHRAELLYFISVVSGWF